MTGLISDARIAAKVFVGMRGVRTEDKVVTVVRHKLFHIRLQKYFGGKTRASKEIRLIFLLLFMVIPPVSCQTHQYSESYDA